ncbi:transglutaminase family protein [Georgenia sp. MJ206]|uniref:transglutaminase family protein n=1 Tax=Georgenia wangjunii TaxID=3117730 RepID=UPI002F262A9A
MSARDAAGRHYRLVHRTTYTYPEPVTSSYGLAVLTPRDGFGQTVRASTVHVDPAPAERAEHTDTSGNRTTHFRVAEPHTVLEVRAESVLTVTRNPVQVDHVPQLAWEEVVAAARTMRTTGAGRHGEGTAAVLAVVDGALPSELVEPDDEVLAYALPSFRPGVPLVHVVADLAHRIRADFTYRTGSTTIHTRLPEVLARRTGVCQDFAHLMCACLRALGLPARYVSGYLETLPPPGRPKLRGVDASHAWVAVWLPGGGWLHVDPTNDQFIDDRYVVLGWGRDFRDVSPLRGIVLTTGTGSTLSVGVDLEPIPLAEALAVTDRRRQHAGEDRPNSDRRSRDGTHDRDDEHGRPRGDGGVRPAAPPRGPAHPPA